MSARVTDNAAARAPIVVTPASALRLHKRCACGGEAGLTGECESCSSRKLSVQRRGDGSSAQGAIPRSVDHALSLPGRPLEPSTQNVMETRFGHDFSSVRVHDDAVAAQSARDVHALAYTVGQDIVFAPGQYVPHSESGQRLLAHELAHTVQQRGLQRTGALDLVDQGPEYRRLEAEADAVADSVMRGGTSHDLRLASQLMMSRATDGTSIESTGSIGRETKQVRVTTAYMDTTTHDVTPLGGHELGGSAIQAFAVDPLYVPATKGPRAMALYQSAAGGALQATISVPDSMRSVQWQQRADTDALRARWLNIMGWQAGADANSRWQAAGGDATFPRVNGATCQMDHIIELQISGNNTDDNIQALDEKQNRDSGGAIKTQLFGLAKAIHDDRDLTAPTTSEVQLRFRSVKLTGTKDHPAPERLPTQSPPAVSTCLAVEHCARQAKGTRTDAAKDGAVTLDDYKVSAGGVPTTLRVPQGFSTTKNAPGVDIAGNPANQFASELISGLLLARLRRGGPPGGDTVDAGLDTRSRTRVPLTLEGATDSIKLDVLAPGSGGARRMELRDATPNLKFTYPYLSPGRITHMSVTPQRQVNWRGEIDSKIPFLPNPLRVIYEKESLRVGVELNRTQLRSPLPGFTLTDARLDMSLAPELSASGHLAFTIGTGSTAIATGRVELTADASGFSGTGELKAHIPGVDEVSGRITLRNGAWAGQIIVEAAQIRRIPNLQSGRLQLDLDSTGLRPSGALAILLPRNLGNATLGFTRAGTRFVYTGTGTLRVPGLHEVGIDARYDGETLSATANNVAFRWHGLDGKINVTYTSTGNGPGRITGAGHLGIKRGDVHGNVAVTLHDSGRFSGHGRVTYPFTIQGQRLEASAGVIVDEAQHVRVEGALRFPQPIQLFRRFGDQRQLFRLQHSIPIPGLNIGMVGVVAVIEGSISVRYGFGPGELRNVTLEAAFNPLAEKIDPNVAFSCQLHVPVQAGFAGTIGGGIGVEAGLGRVNGTLTVTADLGLDAVLGGPLAARYENRRFAVNARPGIDASLALGLSLDAHARAEAGIGRFSTGVDKSWNLGRRTIVLGKFSMYAPLGWSSDSGFTPPKADQIEWGPLPQIDPGSLLSQLFNAASAQERST